MVRGIGIVAAGLLACVLAGCATGSANMQRIDAQMTGSFFPDSVSELAAGRAFHQEALRLRAQIVEKCMSRRNGIPELAGAGGRWRHPDAAPARTVRAGHRPARAG